MSTDPAAYLAAEAAELRREAVRWKPGSPERSRAEGLT